jgi:hypothetical protein
MAPQKEREIIYSTQRTGFEEGRRYANPRFFNGQVRSGITSVIVVGDYPAVVDAYKRAGIPVRVISPGAPLSDAEDAPVEGSGENFVEGVPADFEFPNDEALDELDWSDLRTMVKSLKGTVTNKADAIAFIREKREAASAASD